MQVKLLGLLLPPRAWRFEEKRNIYLNIPANIKANPPPNPLWENSSLLIIKYRWPTSLESALLMANGVSSALRFPTTDGKYADLSSLFLAVVKMMRSSGFKFWPNKSLIILRRRICWASTFFRYIVITSWFTCACRKIQPPLVLSIK